jgi:hypothetical protein
LLGKHKTAAFQWIHFFVMPFTEKNTKSTARQGDQIGRIFALWVIVYFRAFF